MSQFRRNVMSEKATVEKVGPERLAIDQNVVEQAAVEQASAELALAGFDYNAEAELFPSRSRKSRRQVIGYKRFGHAADALRFAIEELPPEFLQGAYLQVDEERYDSGEIRTLYKSTDYPLARVTTT
jgi:hypothetical protein